MDPEVKKALLAVIPVLLGVLATGLAGSGLAYWWNLQLKKRDADLSTMKLFHELYGEFFAVWKLWNYYARNKGSEHFPDVSRWKILERACAAEGKMEAILIDLSSKYCADVNSLEELGRFRQVYQQLREAIANNEALAWDWSDQPVYLEFKRLAPVIAHMARSRRGSGRPSYDAQTKAWLDVTHNRHERFWDKPGTDSKSKTVSLQRS